MAQETNTTVRGPMESAGAATPTFRFRRTGTPYTSVGVMVYTGTAWVGTIQIQISDPGRNSWVTIEEWIVDGYKSITPPSDCDIRLYFSARTSGTPIGAIINNA